jgi:hypothetical protein
LKVPEPDVYLATLSAVETLFNHGSAPMDTDCPVSRLGQDTCLLFIGHFWSNLPFSPVLLQRAVISLQSKVTSL